MADTSNLPAHVGIIMDGNGRWAKAHFVPRVVGHNAGMESMKKIVIATSDLGIKNLTVYAFSTENWKRSTEEVTGIFNLIVKYVNSELKELNDNNVHINIFGQYYMLPQASIDAIDRMLESTAANDGLNFNIALNYGGRDEIVRAVNELFVERQELALNGTIEDVTEADISKYLYTGLKHYDIPDPDLIIRTSGEERISNFLVWQSAYSELMFTDTLWPDFAPAEYKEMINKYTLRKRRFGGREKEDK